MADVAYRTVHAMSTVQARKLLIETYEQTQSISETARRWRTSRQVVRKWVRRYAALGEAGLHDRSRRPRTCPQQTEPEIEQMVREAREATRYGRERLAFYLQKEGLDISPHTIRHILRRGDPIKRTRNRRKPVYPALWAWSTEEPFSLIQTDLKDILDKGALGTKLWNHLCKHGLPRYQWTACDGRTRVRFVAYSHKKTRDNGMSFMILVLLWLRTWGIECSVSFQTDWGEEFGGSNLEMITALEKRFLAPLQGQLTRYPKGRKEYNGRVERSHRSDDEELYRPYLLSMKNESDTLDLATRWIYFYNVLRPHFGKGMNKEPPLQVLQRLGYNGSDQIALFPPILLDQISADLLIACDPEAGNNLLASYSFKHGTRSTVLDQ